jgi:hypothetical protein
MSKEGPSPAEDVKAKTKPRVRLVAADFPSFRPTFERVKWISGTPQVLVSETHNPAHVLACLMLKYNRDAFIADVRGKLSWTNAGPKTGS